MLDKEERSLVLLIRPKAAEPQLVANKIPGEWHELVGTCCCTCIPGGIDHAIRMPIHRCHQASSEPHPIDEVSPAFQVPSANRIVLSRALRSGVITYFNPIVLASPGSTRDCERGAADVARSDAGEALVAAWAELSASDSG